MVGAHGLSKPIADYIARKYGSAVSTKLSRAIQAARASTSTGQYVDPNQYLGAPWLSQAARQALYAKGASGS